MAEAAAEVLRAAGYEVWTGLTVDEGAAAVQELRPDLVLTEYLVGEATGLDLLERLGRLTQTPPTVLATGCGSEDAAARALALGAWSYVLKTETYLRELPGLVRRFLDESGARRQDREREKRRGRLVAQNELAGWLAHNFKNILAASLGYLNLIDFQNPAQTPAKREEYLTESRRSQKAALDLLEQLIRLTEAEVEAEVEPVIVAEVVDEAWAAAGAAVLVDAEGRSPERLAEVRTQAAQVVLMNSVRRLPPVKFVRADLAAVLAALVRNSLEAVLGQEDPRVLVFGEVQGPRLELMVRDNGRGMTEEVASRAQEPLFSTKGEVGVGLGLSLVAALVERHGGALDIQSAPGAGTTVRLSCPLKT